MGLDLLDITFRAERAFRIRMPDNWLERLGVVRRGDDATLGQLHQMLLDLCREQRVSPPPDSWDVLVNVVQDATGHDDPTPETTLREVAPHG